MKKIIPFILAFALSSCMGNPYAEHAVRKEAELWKAANAKADRHCAQYKKSDRMQTVQAGDCISGVVREIVLPHAAFPDLLVALINDQAAVSRKYRDGAVDLKQAKAESRQLQSRYQTEVTLRLNQK